MGTTLKILIAGKFVPTGNNKIGGLQSWIKTVENEYEQNTNNQSHFYFFLFK